MPAIAVGLGIGFVATMGGASLTLSQYTATELDDFTLTISGPALVGATSVEIFDNGVSIGTDADGAPITYAYVDITAGAHVITVAIDGAAQRAAGTITVTAAAADFIQVSAGAFVQVSAGDFIQVS